MKIIKADEEDFNALCDDLDEKGIAYHLVRQKIAGNPSWKFMIDGVECGEVWLHDHKTSIEFDIKALAGFV